MKIFNSIEDGCVSFVQYVKEINNGWSESDTPTYIQRLVIGAGCCKVN